MENAKAKTITIAFNAAEYPYFGKIKCMSNQEIRDLIGIDTYQQLSALANAEGRTINNIIKHRLKKNISFDIKPSDSTFVTSKTIPFQRWYPYIEGYSPDYVVSLIQKYLPFQTNVIYDPFVGTGTTIFGADDLNITTVYSEINPVLQFIIDTKISILKASNTIRQKISNDLKKTANKLPEILFKYTAEQQLNENYKKLFGNSIYFDEETYHNLLRLRSFIDITKLTDSLLADMVTIAVLASLIPVSFLKKQGDVRFKNKKELLHEKVYLLEYLSKKFNEMAEDILNYEYKLNTNPAFLVANAKNIGFIYDINIDAVITSPPYLNGTNYFRNTKLELWFLRYIQFEDDLRFLRNQALTCGINDVTRSASAFIDNDILKRSDLLQVAFNELQKKAYDKRIPVMINNYFSEVVTVFSKLLPLLSNNAKIIIDIGDSIFSGVHVQTDDILIDLFKDRYNLIEKKEIRKRRSKNNMILRQTLLVFEAKSVKKTRKTSVSFYWQSDWNIFKTTLPHQTLPYSKKTWGHPNHSLCSYQGKLKPAIAYHLVNTFIPKGGKMLDPFSGVGTIPFESAIKGCVSYGIDISLSAFYIASAKVSNNIQAICNDYIEKMRFCIENDTCTTDELEDVKNFGFNKTIAEYYEKKTLREIILARRFLKENKPKNSSEMLVVSSLLHILHGNRPYALSRRSHPIVPYAPQGEFEYKNVIEKLKEKVGKYFKETLPADFVPGKIFNQDSTSVWPQEIDNLDAVITSPPFFDSTRFYLANWLRIWFVGWSENDFKNKINSFIEEKQKTDFSIYENIFRQSRERLKQGGVLVLHLGKSKKCDMAEELQKISRYWFTKADLFLENVEHCESHGIRDKGTVTSHQYLILI
jgi:tRNA G10  N-methylase Trm11